MKLRLYVVRDKLAEDATPPMAFANDDIARRTFFNSMKENPNVCDFDLYFVGTYNTSSMDLEASIPELLDTNQEKIKINEISRSQAVKDESQTV